MAINVAAKADIPGAPTFANWVQQAKQEGGDPTYANYLFVNGYQANGTPTPDLNALGYQPVMDRSTGDQMTLNGLGVVFNPTTGRYYLDTVGGVNGSTGWGTPDANGLIDGGDNLSALIQKAVNNRNANYKGGDAISDFLGTFGPAAMMAGVGYLAAPAAAAGMGNSALQSIYGTGAGGFGSLAPDLLASVTPTISGLEAAGAGGLALSGAGLGAAGEVASAPPSSYWSMLADSSGSGVPSAAAGTVGSGAADLTVEQLAQIYQSSGMSAADAMAAAQQAASAGGLTGSAAGAYTGIASQVNPSIIQQLLNTPTPPTSLPGGSNSPAPLPPTTPPSGAPLPAPTAVDPKAVSGAASAANSTALSRILDGTASTADYLQAGIPVGSQILSGLMGSSAAGKAADAQLAASNAAIAENARQYNQTRTDNLPFLQTGQQANARLRQLLGLDPQYTASDSGSLVRPFAASDLNSDPVYQSGLDFGLKTGTGAINARALANGSYDSGATLKELTRYGNDYGSTKANDSYNRYNTNNTNTYNRLAGVSGAGQTAANTVSAAGQNQANNNTNLITGAGNANAASIVGGAQAWGGALSGIGNAVTQDANNARLLALLKSSNPSQYGY